MKLLFLITSSLDYPYGLGRCGPLARELVKLGHQVTIAALHPALKCVTSCSFEDAGVQVKYVGPMHVRQVGDERQYYGPAGLAWAVLRGTWGLTLQALLTDADAIHIGKTQPMNGLAGLLGKWLRGRPIYLDCDDYEAESNRFGSDWQKRIVAFWEDGLPRHARGISVNTRFMQTRLEGLGYPPEQIAFIPNGIEQDRFPPPRPEQIEALRQQLGLEEQPVVGYIGSLSLTSHAVDLLLDSFTCLRATHPNAVLLLVGGGEDYHAVQKQATALQLGDAVRFVGQVPADNVPAYYALADVTVDPVHDDLVARARCPLKIVESLAMGTPVVTGDVGDRRELLADGQAGILVSPGDPNALATGLAQILDDPDLARSLSQGAWNQRARYLWDQIVGPLVKLYEKHQRL